MFTACPLLSQGGFDCAYKECTNKFDILINSTRKWKFHQLMKTDQFKIIEFLSLSFKFIFTYRQSPQFPFPGVI